VSGPPVSGPPVSGPPPGPPFPVRPRRPWWRSPGLLAVLCAVVLVVGGGAYLVHGRANTAGVGTALVAPGCTASTARAASLTKVGSQLIKLGGHPFGVTTTPDGRFSFVTVGHGVELLASGDGLAPTPVKKISVANVFEGAAMTPDGRYLLAASASGAVVVNVAEAERGAASPVTGTLTSPHGSGAAEVDISPDGRFAFVTLQNSAEVAVFNLQRGLSRGFGPDDFVGYVPTDYQPVGITTSPDGRWLYVTSIQRRPGPGPAQGTLRLVSVHDAETNPGKAVVSTVAAGCSPVRVITSADGGTVWVTARQSNALLAFSAAKLQNDRSPALIAKVSVGATPIGLALVHGGTRIVVADANTNNLPGISANLAVVNTSAALAGNPALLGYIPSGLVPRELAPVPGRSTLLVTNFGAGQLQAVNVADLP